MIEDYKKRDDTRRLVTDGGGRVTCSAFKKFPGYDATQWQALVHEPESYPGADDGACYWMNIDSCDSDPYA